MHKNFIHVNFLSKKLGGASSFIQLHMDDGSLYYGLIKPKVGTTDWMEGPSPQPFETYSVVINLEHSISTVVEHDHLVMIYTDGHMPSPNHRPESAMILYMEYCTTVGIFVPYNYEDPSCSEPYRMWITIKGTNTVLTAKLAKGTYDQSKIHPQVIQSFRDRYNRENPPGKPIFWKNRSSSYRKRSRGGQHQSSSGY